jgi:lipid-A-disaccharide synthase
VSGPVVYLSAGEPSGDALGARLAGALRAAAPAVRLEGMGGAHMATAGVEILHPAGHLAANGLVEAAGSLPAHLRLLRDVRRRFRQVRYDLAVFIDYPGFHLAAARAARAAGVPVVHYVAPQLWAWGGWRADRLRGSVDRLAVILPFEEAFFRARGIEARFVGHPLLDEPVRTRGQARAELGLDPEARVLALFPGSRPAEIRRLWPVFREAALRLRRDMPDLVVVAAGLATATYPRDAGVLFRWDAGPVVAAAADAALCKSGTTSLEAALAGTPHVVAYRTHPVTWAAARRLVRVPWVSLVNLLAEETVVPELLQRAATAPALANAVGPLLAGAPVAARQMAAFELVRDRLGSRGAATRVAALALELVA